MPVNIEEHIRLLEAMVEQQKMHIQSQDARILEQERTIADLRAPVDELHLFKVGMEETLEELKRQLFGAKKIIAAAWRMNGQPARHHARTLEPGQESMAHSPAKTGSAPEPVF